MPQVTFVWPDGSEKTFDAPVGISLLEVAHKNDVPLEGACEGSLACSTCHVIVDPAWYARTGNIENSELQVLKMTPESDLTSRLACQIRVTDELDGLVVRLPEFQM